LGGEGTGASGGKRPYVSARGGEQNIHPQGRNRDGREEKRRLQPETSHKKHLYVADEGQKVLYAKQRKGKRKLG